MKQMVHLFAACWNDIESLDFFFRHYDPWVERYVIFDDGSTDGSCERLAEHPRVELRELERVHPDSLVLSLLHLYDHAWKESRGLADWVVVTNLDEHLYHPDIGRYLQACREAGVTAIPALGYQMVAERTPQPGATLARAVTRGVPWRQMSKLDLFDPLAVEEVNYMPGRHVAKPIGRIVYPERDELLNLHFKLMGLDRVLSRHAKQRTRLRERDLDKGWGHRYLFGAEETAAWFAELQRSAVRPLAADAVPDRDHAEPRWWHATPSPDSGPRP